MSDPNKSPKARLLEEILKRGNQFDAYAIDSALAAAREPNKKELLEEAHRLITLSDSMNKMAKDICGLVHKYF